MVADRMGKITQAEIRDFLRADKSIYRPATLSFAPGVEPCRDGYNLDGILFILA